jgi:hypothetical protein
MVSLYYISQALYQLVRLISQLILTITYVKSRYGCPDIEDIESFNNIYKERLDEIIEKGEIPIDLALEVHILCLNPNNAIIFHQ